MSTWFYRLLIWLSRFFGYQVIHVFSWFISTCYFLFFPMRVTNSVRFYRALFTDKSFLEHLALSWRQFHHFAGVYADRQKAINGEKFELVEKGQKPIVKAIKENTGGVILTSHLGNWELASILFSRLYPIKLMLYVGINQREQIEALQKKDLLAKGIKLVSVSEDTASPLDLIEAVQFIKGGGFVAIMGDRIWTPSQQVGQAEFLNHKIDLPTAPYILAQLCRVPVFPLFAIRLGERKFLISVNTLQPEPVQSRSDRVLAANNMMQKYADLLAKMAAEHPEHWYHFESFIRSGDTF